MRYFGRRPFGYGPTPLTGGGVLCYLMSLIVGLLIGVVAGIVLGVLGLITKAIRYLSAKRRASVRGVTPSRSIPY